MQNRIIYKIASHVLPWLAILFLPLIIFGDYEAEPGRIRIMFYVNFALVVLTFYANKYVFIPKFLYKQKFWMFGAACVFSLIFAFFTTKAMFHYVAPQLFKNFYEDTNEAELFIDKDKLQNLSDRDKIIAYRNYSKEYIKGEPVTNPQKSIIAVLVALTLSTSLSMTKKWYQNELQNKEMAKEQFETELMFLKSQVNPHFLFNTLNGIYSLANKKSDKTADAIVKLSSLIRYMLYDSNKDFVNLEDELEYIRNYIDLQSLRLHDDVDLSLNIKGSADAKLIAPMLLVPFIENAFKHGIDYSIKSHVHIKISIEKTELKLWVVNSKNNEKPQNDDKNSGVGLKNVKRRLELVYPEKHLLNISESEDEYTTSLTLILNENELSHS